MVIKISEAERNKITSQTITRTLPRVPTSNILQLIPQLTTNPTVSITPTSVRTVAPIIRPVIKPITPDTELPLAFAFRQLTEGPKVFTGGKTIDEAFAAKKLSRKATKFETRTLEIFGAKRDFKDEPILPAIQAGIDKTSLQLLKIGSRVSGIKNPLREGSTIGTLITPKSLENLEIPQKDAIEFLSTTIKFGIFEPFLRVGAAQKAIQKAKKVQKTKTKKDGKTKVTSGLQFSDDIIAGAERNIQNTFFREGAQPIRELYRRALKTGNKKLIKDTKTILDNAIGKKDAGKIIKDVRQQELLVEGTVLPVKVVPTKTPPPPKFKGIPASEFAGRGPQFEFGPEISIPQIKKLPAGSITSSGSLTGLSPLQRNLERIRQEQEKNRVRSNLENLSLADRAKLFEKGKLSIFGTLLGTSSAQALDQKQESQQEQRLKTLQRQNNAQDELLRQQQQERTSQKFKQLTKTLQLQLLKQQQRARQRLRTSGLKKLRRLRLVPLLFPFSKGKQEFKKPTKLLKGKGKLGYNAFAKKQGSKKFIKLNLRPLTKVKARDSMAFFVDRTLSATGKIVRAKKIAKKPLIKIPRNYFKNNSLKFREFKIRKGKKIPTPNIFIEKRKKRLDTPGERKRIKVANLLARKKRQVKKTGRKKK